MSERRCAGSGDGDDEAIDVDDFDRRRQQPRRGNIIDEPPLTQFVFLSILFQKINF